jgi:hypothetical protein
LPGRSCDPHNSDRCKSRLIEHAKNGGPEKANETKFALDFLKQRIELAATTKVKFVRGPRTLRDGSFARRKVDVSTRGYEDP